jgi:signal peptidase I
LSRKFDILPSKTRDIIFFVLILKIPFFSKSIRPGDIVVFNNSKYGTLIKQVDHIDPKTGSLSVSGTNEYSVDSQRIGFVRSQEVIGKVIWHIKKP